MENSYIQIYDDGDTTIFIYKEDDKYYIDFHGWDGSATKEISKQTYEGLLKDHERW